MAIVRWVYRRRKVFFFVMCASTFWIAYLYLSLPQPKEKRLKDFVSQHVETIGADSKKRIISSTARINTPPKPKLIDSSHLVLQPPPDEFQGEKVEKGETVINSSKTAVSNSENISKPDDRAVKKWINIGDVGSQIKNKTWEMGARFKNKTFEMAETVRNKTLQHLAVFGVGKKLNTIRLISEPSRWNLSLSFDDIGNIMKDTEFLNKLQPLDLSSPVLASSKNRTANYTYNMPFHVGFCDCYEHHCVCCARISNKRLHMNMTTCTNFTFLSKSQELEMEVILDSKSIYKNSISADSPPLVCLGTYPKVVDLCVHFFNMTFKVNVHHEHKTQLLGCTDFSLNLYNKTIGSFPVDCFQIPGDPNHKHKESLNVFNFPNWMP